MDIAPVHHVEIVDGQARIKGTPFKAKLVASMHVIAGASIEEVMEQYNLSRAQVYAALAYYYDNQEEIEQSFRDAEAYVREVGISSEELATKLQARKQNLNR